jgi:polynucleotide 5'-kinase involved in rRNA processing
LIIINYHGWVYGTRAFLNIINFIEKLGINGVVILEDFRLKYNFNLINSLGKIKVKIYFAKRPDIDARTHHIRKKIRERKYRSFLLKTKLWEYKYSLLEVLKEMNPQIHVPRRKKKIYKLIKDYVGVEKEPEYIIVTKDRIRSYYYSNITYTVLNKSMIDEVDIPIEIYVLPRDNIGILIGARKKSTYIPGILKNIDFKREEISVLLPREKFPRKHDIETIKIGKIILDKDGNERRVLRKAII